MVLVIVAVGGLVVYQLSQHSSGNSNSGSSGPEDVVHTYLVALQDRDCASLVNLVTESSRQAEASTTVEDAQAECEGSLRDNPPTWADGLSSESIEVLSNDGTLAVVSISPAGGEPAATPHELVLRNQDGTWLIDWTAEVPRGSGEPTDASDTSAGAPPDEPGQDGGESGGQGGGVGPGGGATTPLPAEDVVYAFYDLAEEVDCPGLVSITTPDYWGLNTFTADETDMLDTCEQEAADGNVTPHHEVQNVELNDSVQAGSSGWATVEVTVDGAPETHELDLQAEDDGYLVRGLTNL